MRKKTLKPVLKTARIDFRCEEAEKEVISKAAASQGQEISEFILTPTLTRARNILRKIKKANKFLTNQ